MNVIDTNIWIYSYDPRDPQKELAAKTLIASLRPLALLWQVGCEFIAASRKLASAGFDEADAWAALSDMQTMASVVLMPTSLLWQESYSLQSRHSLSFWDVLLIAACIQGGVNVLYTEDMGAPRQIDGLSLINPFVVSQTP